MTVNINYLVLYLNIHCCLTNLLRPLRGEGWAEG
jgi:hypothetical protein